MRQLSRGRLVLAAAAVGAVGALCSGPALATSPPVRAASAPTQSMAIPVDRQDYVTAYTAQNPQDGSTVDPYDGDPSSIHVAINGGQEFARSFVHLALDYLPSGAQGDDAVMTLFVTQQSDASSSGVYTIYNVNPGQAIVQACVLTAELPSNFNPQDPPPYSCAQGSAVGRPSPDGSKWTFDLRDLVRYWNQHGNTGAALVPVGSGDPSQTWAVAFYKSRSAAQVTYSVPAGPAATGTAIQSGAGPTGTGPTATGQAAPTPPAPGANASSGRGGSGTYAAGDGGAIQPSSPTAATANPVAAAPAPSHLSTAPAAPNAPTVSPSGARTLTSSGGSSPVWPWILLACLAVAAGAIGVAHRDALLAALPKTTAIWKTHPRAYSVAAAALVWGIVFGAYSAATSPSRNTVTTAAGTLGSGPAASQTGGSAGAGSGTYSSGSGGAGSGQTGASGGQTAGLASAGGSGSVTGSTGGGAGAAPTSAAGTSGPAAPGGGPAATEFSGAGTWKTINGVRVFFPANGGPPEAQLYSGADNTIGITSNQIELCAHAALTYGAAFNISASDLNVYWDYVNDHGGIFGRKVHGDYENDNYDPGQAVQAAQACKDLNTFFLIGGIGFDQIPAVRQWAEQNHELYLHHIATIEGSQGLRYSFSALPTVEQVGTWFGELVAHQFHGQKVGIIYRDSSNWTPGVDTFKQAVEAAGNQIVGSYGVQINQGNYTQELTELRTAGAQVILSWENALAEVEMIKQAEAQNWHPAWLVNPFNLITNTLGPNALDQDIWGVAEWDAYDPGYYGGGFTSYADQIHQFEAQYKQYDPNASLSGDGGDLLFLNWEAQKYEDALLTACGPDCTRNKVAGLLLAGFDQTVPPNCPVNFGRTSDHHHGGYTFNVLHDVKDPNGRANFVPVARCVTSY